jgi:hypothetical protein
VRSSLIRRCGILALVAILAIGNSAGIQAIAWVSMIVSRVQTVTVGEAIASTLNGSRPCALCKIAKGLATAEDSALLNHSAGKVPLKQHPSPAMKWTMDEPWMMPADPLAEQTVMWPTLRQLANSHSSAPPTPPPRA